MLDFSTFDPSIILRSQDVRSYVSRFDLRNDKPSTEDDTGDIFFPQHPGFRAKREPDAFR
jgi:hypothetical protein